jgi:hypothetical protein
MANFFHFLVGCVSLTSPLMNNFLKLNCQHYYFALPYLY